jgi:hypothetical protein
MKLGIAVPTQSGNPFHDVFSGKFTYAPPGVNIIIGKQIVKDLQPSAGKILAEAARKVKPNQMSAVIEDGMIVFNLFRDGRLLTSFSVPQESSGEGEKGKKPPAQDDKSLDKGLPVGTGAFRDAVVDAARETSLEGDALKSFFEEKLGIKLDERQVTRLAELVDEQRINDLSDYLNIYLREGSNTNALRISAPRGFVRKAFANLEIDVIHDVFARLRARGWSDEILNDKIVKQFSKERQRLVSGRNLPPDKEKEKK